MAVSQDSAGSLRFQVFALAVCSIGIAFLVMQILRATGGSLFYALDDPYIHLALAENLRVGHYGINPGETASPSSSMLYPFLLAATLMVGFGTYGPLVLSVVGALGSAWVLSGMVWRAFEGTREAAKPAPWLLYGVMPLLLVAVNGYALALTGMEHTLHVLASLLILRGLTQLTREGGPDIWLFIGLVAAPLLRFEGFALSLAAIAALLIWGRWQIALSALGVLAALVGGYVMLMAQLGLPPLPSSVLVKSDATAAVVDQSFAGAIAAQVEKIVAAFDRIQVRWFAGGLIALCVGFLPPFSKMRITVALVIGTAACAQLLVGRWGWFGRYEVYIMTCLWGAVLIVWTPILSRARVRMVGQIALLCLAFFATRNYITPFFTTHLAARNVMAQQYQMHVFATEYFPHVTAVNDLGWVAYDNDNYVLDLWGLGSETARQNWTQHGLDATWIAQMAAEKDAKFAMVYPGVFKDNIPADWCLMGVIRTERVTSAYEYVGFYLIDPAMRSDMGAALDRFAAQLPAATGYTAIDCTAAPYDWRLWQE